MFGSLLHVNACGSEKNEWAPPCCEVKGQCRSECSFISDKEMVRVENSCGQIMIQVRDQLPVGPAVHRIKLGPV